MPPLPPKKKNTSSKPNFSSRASQSTSSRSFSLREEDDVSPVATETDALVETASRAGLTSPSPPHAPPPQLHPSAASPHLVTEAALNVVSNEVKVIYVIGGCACTDKDLRIEISASERFTNEFSPDLVVTPLHRSPDDRTRSLMLVETSFTTSESGTTWYSRLCSPGQYLSSWDKPKKRTLSGPLNVLVCTKTFLTGNYDCSTDQHRDAVLKALELLRERTVGLPLQTRCEVVHQNIFAWPPPNAWLPEMRAREFAPSTTVTSPDDFVLMAVMWHALRDFAANVGKAPATFSPELGNFFSVDAAAVKRAVNPLRSQERVQVIRFVEAWLEKRAVDFFGEEMLPWFEFIFSAKEIQVNPVLVKRLQAQDELAKKYVALFPESVPDTLKPFYNCVTLQELYRDAKRASAKFSAIAEAATHLAQKNLAYKNNVLKSDRAQSELLAALSIADLCDPPEACQAYLKMLSASDALSFTDNRYLLDSAPLDAFLAVLPFLTLGLRVGSKDAVTKLRANFREHFIFYTHNRRFESTPKAKVMYAILNATLNAAGDVTDLTTQLLSDLEHLWPHGEEGLLASVSALEEVSPLPKALLDVESSRLLVCASKLTNVRPVYIKIRRALNARDPKPLLMQLMSVCVDRMFDRIATLLQAEKGPLVAAFANSGAAWDEESSKGSNLALLLTNEEAQQFFTLVTNDSQAFPRWMEQEAWARASAWCRDAVAAAARLRQVVKDRSCLVKYLDAIRALPSKSLMPEAPFEKLTVLVLEDFRAADEKVTEVRHAWGVEMSILTSMLDVPALRASVEAIVIDLQNKFAAMERQPINLWMLPPSVSTEHIRSTHTFFQSASRSSLAAQLFAEAFRLEHQTIGDDNETTPVQRIQRWSDLVNSARKKWSLLCSKGADLSLSTISTFFGSYGAVKRTVRDRGQLDQASYRRHADEVHKQRREVVFLNVHRELELAQNLLPEFQLQGSLDEHVGLLRDVLLAWNDVTTIEAAVSCCRSLKVQLTAASPELAFIDLAERGDEATGRQLVDAWKSIAVQPHNPLKAPINFFVTFKLAIDHGLFRLFSTFLVTRTLSQAIADRTNGNIDPRDMENLNGFELIHRAFSGTDGIGNKFVQLVKGRLNSSAEFFNYCEEVSWCADKLAEYAGSLERVEDLLKDAIDNHDDAVSTVVELSQPTSVVYIRTTSDAHSIAKVMLLATTEKRGLDKALTAADLEDIYFQLTIAGSNADQSHRDVLALYLRKYDLIKEIAKLCEQLAAEGHPSFQNQEIACGMAQTPEIIEEDVRDVLKHTLQQFVLFKSEAERRYPLLRLLQPHELVECIQAVMNTEAPFADAERLAATLIHALLPLASKREVEDKIRASLLGIDEKMSMQRVAEALHEVMQSVIQTVSPQLPVVTDPQLDAARTAFRDASESSRLWDRLGDDPASDVTVIRIPTSCAALSASLAVAIYAVAFNRAPTALELLICEHTTPHAPSFVRRWASSLKASLPGHEFLFGLTGVERLPPKEQAALLDSIVQLRRDRASEVNDAKLFIIVADDEQESSLSSELRAACITLSVEAIETAAQVTKCYCKNSKTTVTMSERPSCGKTQVALRHAQRLGRRFGSAIADGSTATFVENVKAVNQSREDGENIVLHLSVAHNACGLRLNDQMLEFVILGRVSDGRHATALRAADDEIVIELPSEGLLHTSFRRDIPVLGWFESHSCPQTISAELLQLAPSGVATLHDVMPAMIANRMMNEGLRILYAFDEATRTREQRLTHHEFLSTIQLDDAKSTELLWKYSPIAKKNNDFGTLIRFAKFLLAQLAGVYSFELYQAATQEAEEDDDDDEFGCTLPSSRMHNYRALGFFMTKFAIEAAETFASASVKPPSNENDDESSRLAGLFDLQFENLRHPFFFVLGGTYEFVTADDDHLVVYFDKKWNQNRRGQPTDYDWDSDFHAMAVHLGQRQGDTLVASLRCLSASDERPPVPSFRHVLPVLGLRPNFGIKVCEALSRLEEIKQEKSLSDDADFPSASQGSEVLKEGGDELQAVSSDWSRCVQNGKTSVLKFRREAMKWLQSLTPSPHCSTQPFVLTPDSLTRALAIKIRLQSGIPVVLQGETGQGKTHLIQYLSRVAGTLFEIINIHRGVTAPELAERLQQIEVRLQKERERLASTSLQPIAIVVLDEVNSMENVWIAKSLVCDRLILGRVVSPEISFVCIMNPWRRRDSTVVPGLDFVQHQEATASSHLVYDVHRSPEAFMAVVWDFGLAHKSYQDANAVQLHLWRDRLNAPHDWKSLTDEHIFAESILSWHLRQMSEKPWFGGLSAQLRAVGDNDGHRHLGHLRTLCVILVDVAQTFLRSLEGECAVSLRDIARAISLIPFVYELQLEHAKCHGATCQSGNTPFAMLQRAVCCALVLNYMLRLPEHDRLRLEANLLEGWKKWRGLCRQAIDEGFMVCPPRVYSEFDVASAKVCEQLVLDDGMAVNCALKENVMSLFTSILHPAGTLSQIIVGRPGSTKSASLDALVMSSDPSNTEDRVKFFRRWPAIKKFVIQCTRETTAAAILRVARNAALKQRMHTEGNEKVQCVLVLEEVGIAMFSKHNPLMVLHSLIDRGVTLDDGTVIKLPVIGISNYSLDAAKMNRMRITYRGTPSRKDLIDTARTLMMQQSSVERDHQTSVGATNVERDETWVDSFATAFLDTILSRGSNKEMTAAISWFYGMRDFYSFVTMMKRHLEDQLAAELELKDANKRRRVTCFAHVLHWCLDVNFGGHPNPEVAKYVKQRLIQGIFADRLPTASSVWRPVTEDNELDQTAPLCDMCARMRLYTEFNRHEDAAKNFWFLSQDKNSVPCSDSNADGNVRQILAYAQHRTAPAVSAKYRVRNVLLFSKGNAAVDLLFRLGVLKREETEIVDPRDLSQITSEQIMNDLARVRRCLRTSKTLVLVRASHLYEAMFDVLNQHFAIETHGEECVFRSTLTKDGFTSSVRVSPDHRIIIVEDEASEQLTSPFLNRCIKVNLGIETALASNQRRLHDRLTTVFGAGTKHGDLARRFVPGFCDETIASMALQSTLPAQCTNNDIADAVDRAWLWLVDVACPRRVFQARRGVLPGVDPGDEALQFWWHADSWSPMRTLFAFPAVEDDVPPNDDGTEALAPQNEAAGSMDNENLQGAQQEEARTAEAEPFFPQHVLIFTEQRELHATKVRDTISYFYGDAMVHPQDLMQGNFVLDDALDEFVRGPHTDANTVGVCLVDLSSPAHRVVGAARVDSIVHRVAVRCPARRRIVVVVLLPSTADATIEPYADLGWRLTQRASWYTVFVDEVQDKASNIPHELLVDAGANEDATDAFARALGGALAVVRDTRQRLVSQHLMVGSDFNAVEAEVAACFTPRTFDAVLGFVVRSLGRSTELTHRWQTQALVSVTVAESLREQLTVFLINMVHYALQHLLPVIIEGRSYVHLASEDENVRDMALQLLRSPLMPDVDCEDCMTTEASELHATTVTLDLGMPDFWFPFSAQLRTVLEASTTVEAMDDYLRDKLGVTNISASQVVGYAADLIQARMEDLDPLSARCAAELLVTQIDYRREKLTIPAVHHFVVHQRTDWMSFIAPLLKGLRREGLAAISNFCASLAQTTMTEEVAVASLVDSLVEHASDAISTVDAEATEGDNDELSGDDHDEPRVRFARSDTPDGSEGNQAADQPPCRLLPIARSVAIERLLQCPGAWKLRLHRSSRLMLQQDAATRLCAEKLQPILRCDNAMELLERLEEDDEMMELCIPLLFDLECFAVDEGATEDDLACLLKLVAIAASGKPLPSAVFAQALRRLVQIWRDGRGVTPREFFKALYAPCALEPSGALSLVVSQVAFNVAVEGSLAEFHNLKVKVNVVVQQAAGDELTFCRILRSGLDKYSAWTCAQAILNPNAGATLHAQRHFNDLFSDTRTVYEHTVVAAYTLRVLFATLLDFGALREVLLREKRREDSLLPPQFYAITLVQQASAIGESPQLLHCVHGFHETYLALTSVSAIPPVANNINIAATVFSALLAPQPFVLTHCLKSKVHERLAQALNAPVMSGLTELLPLAVLVAAFVEHLPAELSPTKATVVSVFGHLPPSRTDPESVRAYRGLRVVACITALFQAIMQTDGAAAADPEPERIRQQVAQIHEEIFNIRCPGCSQPFDSFTGCFSVTCDCGQTFCGWCLTPMEDAHGHATECELNPHPGYVFGSVDDWEKANLHRRTTALRAHLQTLLPDVQSALLGVLLPDLQRLHIEVQTLGADPVLSPRVLVDLVRQAVEDLSLSLFGRGDGQALTQWWIAAALTRANGPFATIQDFVDACLHIPIDPMEFANAAQVSALADEQAKVCRDVIVQSDDYLNRLRASEHDIVLTTLESHYLLRQPSTAIQDFWKLVDEDDRFAVLRLLHAAAQSQPQYLEASANKRYSRVLHFLADLQSVCTAKFIDRLTARGTTLAKFVEAGYLDADRADQFRCDVCELWAPVSLILCKTKDELVDAGVAPHVFTLESVTLNNLLPGSDINEPDGGFVLALLEGRSDEWKGLFESSTTVTSALRDSGVPIGDNANRRLFRLQASDMIEYTESLLTDRLLPFFVDPLTGKLSDNTVVNLVPAVTAQPGLLSKPVLKPDGREDTEIPVYYYWDEAQSSFSLFNTMTPFKLLPAEVAADVAQLTNTDADFAAAARSFLLVCVRELASRDRLPISFEEAVKSLVTPLTGAQQRAKNALMNQCGASLQTHHLIALFAAVARGHVTPEAMVDLNAADRGEYEDALDAAVRQLVRDRRELVVSRFIDVARVTSVIYLQRGAKFAPSYFDGAMLELIMFVDDDAQFETFDILDRLGSLRHYTALLSIIENAFRHALADADDAVPAGSRAVRPVFALRLPVRANAEDSQGDDEEASQAATMSSRTAPRNSARNRPEVELAAGLVSVNWKQVPDLNYGNFF